MKFTPGPWMLEEHDDFNYTLRSEHDGMFIARINKSRYADNRQDDMAEANAGLIAAAPEMYELLRKVYTHASHGKPWTDAQLDEINAVLKRAERRAS